MKHVLIMAFLVGQYTSGMTRQCIYESIGNTYTITIKNYQLCPLNIEV